MKPRPWRSAFDAWRRGGAREFVRGVLRKHELWRARTVPADRRYREWFARHRSLWERFAADDREARCLVVHPRRSSPGAATVGAARTDPAPEGGFVLGLAPGDALRPGALHLLASAVRDGADLAYADEDTGGAGEPREPVFKPSWSPLLALTEPRRFPGGPCAISTRLWNRLTPEERRGEWAAVVLRASEHAARITHVPFPLLARDVAAAESESAEADDGMVAAVRESLARRGIDADAEPGRTRGAVRLRPRPDRSVVSILVPTRDRPDLVAPLAEALDRETRHQPIERIWLDHATTDPQARAILAAEAAKPGTRVLRFEGAFNFSRMINAGAAESTGDHLLLLNNDVEPTGNGWIRDLAACLRLPGVGAVGPLLRYPDGTTQHAGIGLGMGTVTAHPFRGMSPDEDVPCFGPRVAREVSALSGACLMLSRRAFEAVGGLDDEFLPVSFSDVDLCLKLSAKGWQVFYEANVELVHHETVSRSPILDVREVACMRSRWARALEADPYLSPALSRLTELPVPARRLHDASPRTWIRGEGHVPASGSDRTRANSAAWRSPR